MTDLLSQLQQQRITSLEDVPPAPEPAAPKRAGKEVLGHEVRVHCPPAPPPPVTAAQVLQQLNDGMAVDVARELPSTKVTLHLERHRLGHLLITRKEVRGTTRLVAQGRYETAWGAPHESRIVVRWPGTPAELDSRLRGAW